MLAHMPLVPVLFTLQNADPSQYKLLYSILMLAYCHKLVYISQTAVVASTIAQCINSVPVWPLKWGRLTTLCKQASNCLRSKVAVPNGDNYEKLNTTIRISFQEWMWCLMEKTVECSGLVLFPWEHMRENGRSTHAQVSVPDSLLVSHAEHVKFQDGAVFTPFTIFGSIRSWPMRTCCTY